GRDRSRRFRRQGGARGLPVRAADRDRLRVGARGLPRIAPRRAELDRGARPQRHDRAAHRRALIMEHLDLYFALVMWGIAIVTVLAYVARALLRGRARFARADADGGSVFLDK